MFNIIIRIFDASTLIPLFFTIFALLCTICMPMILPTNIDLKQMPITNYSFNPWVNILGKYLLLLECSREYLPQTPKSFEILQGACYLMLLGKWFELDEKNGTFLETYMLHNIAKHYHKFNIFVHYQLCVAQYVSMLETHNEYTVRKRTSTITTVAS